MCYNGVTIPHRVPLGLRCAFRRLGFGRTPDPMAALRGGHSCITELRMVEIYDSQESAYGAKPEYSLEEYPLMIRS